MEVREIIHYDKLSDAISFYKGRGYEYIEVPWVVPMHIDDMTRPAKKPRNRVGVDNNVGMYQDEGCLVASGEQGFLWLWLRGVLDPSKKYQALTPCYRFFDNSAHHYPTFMKVELFGEAGCSGMFLQDAKECFLFLGADHVEIKEMAPGAQDLEINDLEVGSYGEAKYLEKRWSYGTGVAEPRFTQACNRYGISQKKNP